MTVRWTWIILLLTGLCEAAAAGDMPQDQKQFIEVVERFHGAKADSDMAKNATRLQRAKAICAAIRTPVVQNWTGTVFKVSTNREGKGVLELTLSTHMRITTWNDSIADVGDRTLIDPKSPLFDQTVLLKKNQEVLFSGSFIPDPTDCFREISMTLSESMDEPEFLFRFSDIAPVPYQIAPYQGTSITEHFEQCTWPALICESNSPSVAPLNSVPIGARLKQMWR
jgi:hypothetical protein